jgi:hypothetical protein
MRYTIVDIIPPRPGATVGTLVFDEHAPARSMVVPITWMRATHVRVGGSVSFGTPGVLRYHWEDIPEELQRIGILDELYPGMSAFRIERELRREQG